MGKGVIRAGCADEVKPEGEWIFADLGFSHRKNSTGYLHLTKWCGEWFDGLGCTLGREDLTTNGLFGAAKARTFAEACKKICAAGQTEAELLRLVLEAPLSCAFHNGNPVPRTGDWREDNGEWKARRWYVQPAPIVTTAALFLLHGLRESCPHREIAIFEGFVSFKGSNKGPDRPADHRADVCALALAVYNKDENALEPPPQPDPGDRKRVHVAPQPLPYLLGGCLAVPPRIYADAPQPGISGKS